MQAHGVVRTAAEALACKVSTRTALSGTVVSPIPAAASPQTPLLNRVYWYRMLLMQKLTRAALHSCRQRGVGEGVRIQLVILGCGYDSAYQQMWDEDGEEEEQRGHLQPSVATFLVDLPPVIQKRLSLDISCDERAALVVADLNEPENLIGKLIENGFDQSQPTIILLECVLCYLSIGSVLALLKHLSLSLRDATVVTYDPIVGTETGASAVETKDNTFSEMITQKFAERGAPILFSCSSKDDHRLFLEGCGFKYNAHFTVNEAVSTLLTTAERSVSPQSEPFDEYASLAILGSRYVVSVSTLHRDAMRSLLLRVSDSLSMPQPKNTIAIILRGICTEDRTVPLPPILQGPNVDFLSIRESRALDKKSIKRLLEECFSVVSEKYTEVKKFLKSSLSRLTEDIAPANSISKFWVITASSGEVVGSVGLRATLSAPRLPLGLGATRHLEIIHLGVDAEHRARGVGRFLLQTVMDYARSLVATIQCDLVELTVIKDLHAAVSLYKKMGFTETNIVNIGNSCHMMHMCLKL